MTKVVYDLLVDTKALLKGHFLLSSGKHSDGYVQCAKLLQYPDKAAIVVEEIVRQLRQEDIQVDKVVGPAMGGIVIAYEVGRQLGVPAIFTERENNEMTLRRGFEIEKGERVLVIEDVITTGKSSLETIKVLEEHGAEVLGLACLANRSDRSKIDYPIYSAIDLEINSYDKETCPLCKEGLGVVKPGSRKF